MSTINPIYVVCWFIGMELGVKAFSSEKAAIEYKARIQTCEPIVIKKIDVTY